jgi:hypothetical protein
MLTVNGTASYKAACLAGLGIIQVPEAGLRELIEAGTLVEVLPDSGRRRCRWPSCIRPAPRAGAGGGLHGLGRRLAGAVAGGELQEPKVDFGRTSCLHRGNCKREASTISFGDRGLRL